MFGSLFKKKRLNNSAHQLFVSIIDQTRIVDFYSKLCVEDSLDGRFDFMSIHMAIVLDKFDRHNDEKDAAVVKRILQETMFDNLDLTLREIGVGDLGVGKKIKVMAEAFYGRMMTYQKLFQLINEEKMTAAIHRNLYRGKEVDAGILQEMTAYVYGQWKYVNEQSIGDVLSGELNFMSYEGVSDGK